MKNAGVCRLKNGVVYKPKSLFYKTHYMHNG